jgi:LysR family pca operon transcriptional activator
MLTANDLLLTLAIAEAGSLTAAAEVLGTSQPALTRSLKELELRAGSQLFVRRARGTTLTAAGEIVAAHARSVRAVTDRAQRQLASHLRTRATELAVGIVPSISIVPTARALTALHDLADGLLVEARVGAADVLLHALRRGALDVYVGPLIENDVESVEIPLFEDHTVLVVRSAHPLRRAGLEGDLDALRRYPWVMPPQSEPAHARVRALFLDAGLEPAAAAIVTGNPALATAIASTTDFIAVLARDVATITVIGGALAILPVELLGTPRVIGAMLRRDTPHAPEITLFLDALRAELRASGVAVQSGA